ncbi:MAG: hypothetical protein AAGG48_29395 [Planctomycetota bacterium]
MGDEACRDRTQELAVRGQSASRSPSFCVDVAGGQLQRNQVEPWAYLRLVFTDLPRGANQEDLLPDQWLATNPNRWAIADRRKEERMAKT